MKPFPRMFLAVALATRTLPPLAAGALLLTGCGGKAKATTAKPKPDTKPKADLNGALADARAAAAAGQVDTAHAKYLEAEKVTVDVTIVDEHVKFLLANDMPDQAVTVAKTYYEAKPADSKGSLIYASALVGAGDFKTAVEIATEVVDLQDTNPAGYEVRGRALMLSKKEDEGLEDLKKAYDLAPTDVNYAASYASGLQKAGRIDQAGLVLNGALSVDENNPRVLRLLGMVRLAQFASQDAVKFLLRATKAAPNDAEGWYSLAIAQNEMGDNTEAEVSAQRATSLAPGKTTYWYVYGEMLRINKKPDDASAAYLRALNGKPAHPKAGGKFALVLYDAGKFGEAESFLTDAIGKDAQNPFLYYNLGWVYGAQKKYKLGVQAFEEYLRLAPKEDGDRNKAVAEIKNMKKKGGIR